MPPHRILHCLRAPVGGLFRHVRDLAREQSRRGHAVGIVCDQGAEDALTQAHLAALAPDLELGIGRLSMPRELGIGDVKAVGSVTAIADAVRADVLHGHGAKGGAYARLAASRLRGRGRQIASFYTPHGGSLHYDPRSLKGRVFMAAERHLARATTGLLFESAYAADIYRSSVGVPACPMRIVANGITPAELEPVTPLADTPPADFLFLGELRRLKGVDLLIDAMASLVRDTPCRLVIAGEGPDGAAFRSKVQELSLDHAITFVGARPARDAFRLGRALVLPSRAESLPYVVLEAAGAGLPLIATRVGGLPEIVAGTDTALVAPNDAAALAAAMRALLVAPGRAADRAERLHAVIARRFSTAAMTSGVLGFYEEALAAREIDQVLSAA